MTPRRPTRSGARRVAAAMLAAGSAAALAAGPAGPAGAATGCLTPPRSLTGAADSTRQLAPGVLVRSWHGVNRRGSQVSLTVAQAAPGRARLVSAVPARLGSAARTADLVARVGGLVGVNGDYFDYDGYGTAVTSGPQVRAGVAQRVQAGWSPFLGTGADGRLRAQDLRPAGVVTLPPLLLGGPARRLAVGAVNAETLPRDRVTLVTGYRNGYRPVAGWEVVLRRGVVLWSGRRAPFGPGRSYGGKDLLLTGTGTAAAALRTVRRGQPVAVSYRTLARDGAVVTEAIGRGAVVLAAGRNVARCDGAGRSSRARTLVGWDPAGSVWLLTVDSGGASVPVGGPGLTYYETAELARRLGATEAALVDGGGSTTLVAATGGVTTRIDAPSWTSQRPVPNGIALLPLR